ncbi:MAG: flavin reductase [Pseudolabrys sp.]
MVLVSSAFKGERNIMTMGWHMVMEFTPSLVGCIIAGGNHSYELVSRSGECVINVPEVHLAAAVAKIGNCSGADTDKFERTRPPRRNIPRPSITAAMACSWCRARASTCAAISGWGCFDGFQSVRSTIC